MASAADQYRALVARLEAIQENTESMAPPSVPEIPSSESMADECGDMGSSSDQPIFGEEGNDLSGGPQVSIRTLIAALQAIEQGSEPQHQHGGDVELFGMDEVQDGGFGNATTEPDEELGDINCVMPTGNDLASKGKEALKRNGGGNPMQEALVNKLAAHYQTIKESK